MTQTRRLVADHHVQLQVEDDRSHTLPAHHESDVTSRD